MEEAERKTEGRQKPDPPRERQDQRDSGPDKPQRRRKLGLRCRVRKLMGADPRLSSVQRVGEVQ